MPSSTLLSATVRPRIALTLATHSPRTFRRVPYTLAPEPEAGEEQPKPAENTATATVAQDSGKKDDGKVKAEDDANEVERGSK
ncbi:hypothetical protein Hypma_012363 [Hypsizygus marmoreus]|uniref:Uncharacterized protein n=1 Tax=Hypsizygus marmoreus TaxID=39966 RepID=A0A369KEF7_HYPMA|nr:hypothetical protein Hypma_012363 [Hypsizygus marmoreus]